MALEWSAGRLFTRLSGLHKGSERLGIGGQIIFDDFKGSQLIGLEWVVLHDALGLFSVFRHAENELAVFQGLSPRTDEMAAIDVPVNIHFVAGIVLFYSEMRLYVLEQNQKYHGLHCFIRPRAV